MDIPEYLLCPCCGCYHRFGFERDCRDDAERFTAEELDLIHEGMWEEVADNW